MKIERRPMSADELMAVKCLQHVTYPVASWDKRFARHIGSVDGITEKEVPQVWRLFKRYRRQIAHPNKMELLTIAEQLAAPDLRKEAAKEAALREERERYEKAMKNGL